MGLTAIQKPQTVGIYLNNIFSNRHSPKIRYPRWQNEWSVELF